MSLGRYINEASGRESTAKLMIHYLLKYTNEKVKFYKINQGAISHPLLFIGN